MLLEEGVCYDQCILLAKPLPHFILYSKAKLVCCSRYLLTSYFCLPVPYDEKDIFFVSFRKSTKLFRVIVQNRLELTPKKDILFIIGDWNAKIGNQEIPEVTGKFGRGIQNEAGQRLTV